MNLKTFKSSYEYRAWKSVAGIALIMILAGCSWTDKQGTHHLIVGLGFGIVTTKNETGIEVFDSRILGAEIGLSGSGVGWLQHHRVAIDPNLASNVLISVNSNPLGMTVKNFNPYSSMPRIGRKQYCEGGHEDGKE